MPASRRTPADHHQGSHTTQEHLGDATVVLDVRDLSWVSSAAVIESALLRRPGVREVQANAGNQTATVVFDPATTSLAQLSAWVRDCGFQISFASSLSPRVFSRASVTSLSASASQ